MCPYIIKTTLDREDDARRLERAGHGCEAYQLRHAPPSRRAVATLDEARQAVALTIGEQRIAMDPDGDHEAAWPDWDQWVHSALGEAFPIVKTFGPLPDGSVIEVERHHIVWFEASLESRGIDSQGMADAEVLDAWNEAHS